MGDGGKGREIVLPSKGSDEERRNIMGIRSEVVGKEGKL